jgi:DNA-binding CsgD family transcriptional regulator
LLVGRDAELERVGELLSARTIEWYLRRVYPKLGVSSRKELRAVLSAS